jgi:hypothetical protein
MPTTTTAATLPASCRRRHRCRCASCRSGAANDAALPPSCQAGCRSHAAAATLLAPPRYCHRPAAALPATTALLRCHHCHRAAIATAVAVLMPSPSRCPRIRCRAVAAAAALPPQLPSLCRRTAATACCYCCLCFYCRRRHCRRRCHGIEQLHCKEGEEDEHGSEQRDRAAHRQGDAPPPTPRCYPDFVVGIT